MKRYFGILAVPVLTATLICAGLYAATFERYVGPTGTQIYLLDDSGNITIPGTVTHVGTINTGNTTTAGKTIITPTVITGISSTTTISPTSTFIQLLSTGGLVTVGQVTNNAGQTYYPAIATATATSGQYITLFSTGNSSVVISTGSGLGSNNGVEGSSAFLSTARPKIVQFIFDAANSIWREVRD